MKGGGNGLLLGFRLDLEVEQGGPYVCRLVSVGDELNQPGDPGLDAVEPPPPLSKVGILGGAQLAQALGDPFAGIGDAGGRQKSLPKRAENAVPGQELLDWQGVWASAALGMVRAPITWSLPSMDSHRCPASPAEKQSAQEIVVLLSRCCPPFGRAIWVARVMSGD